MNAARKLRNERLALNQRISAQRERMRKLAPLRPGEASALIESFIQTRGVTVCEPAFVAASEHACTTCEVGRALVELSRNVKSKPVNKPVTEERRQQVRERQHKRYMREKIAKEAAKVARIWEQRLSEHEHSKRA